MQILPIVHRDMHMASTSIAVALISLFLLTLTGIPSAYSSLDSSPLIRGFTIAPTQISLQWNGGFRPFLTSPNGRFCLGFSEVSARDGAYLLSIMYTIRNESESSSSQSSLDKEPTDMAMVWSANEQKPGSGSSVFTIDHSGRMTLIEGSTMTTLWSPDITGQQLRLVDSGNLVLSDDVGNVWQSFDNPTDTLLPEQNFTASMKLSVSISDAIASVNGTFDLKMEAEGMALYADLGRNASQLAYWRLLAGEESKSINLTLRPIYARIDTMGFMGMYQDQGGEVRVSYSVFTTYNKTEIVHRRMKLGSDGNLRVYYWEYPSWYVDFEAMMEVCDVPSACGPFGICNISNADGCECANGDVVSSGSASASNQTTTNPLRLVTVNGSDARQGCAGMSGGGDENAPDCTAAAADFQRYIRITGVDSVFRKATAKAKEQALMVSSDSTSSIASNASLTDCQAQCDADCQCIAFFFFTNVSSITCFLAYQTALGMQTNRGGDAYIKVGKVPLLHVRQPDSSSSGLRRSSVEIIVASVACLGALGMVLLAVVYFHRRRKSGFTPPPEEMRAFRWNSFRRN